MSKLVKCLFILLFSIFFFKSSLDKIDAKCVPSQCETAGQCIGDPPGTTCTANCCVPPEGGGGGGGGGGGDLNCPVGTRLICQSPLLLSLSCSSVNNFCSGGGYAACGAICYAPFKIYTDTYCSTRPGANLSAACSICYCGSTCNVTAPSNLAYNTDTQTLSWTEGNNGVEQYLYVSANKDDVINNLNGILIEDGSPLCQSGTCTYSVSNLVSTGRIFYAKVTNRKYTSCEASTGIIEFVPSCTVIGPGSLVVGSNAPVSVSLSYDLDYPSPTVNFSSSDTSVATISPSSDSDGSNGFGTSVTGESVGTTILNANTVLSGTTYNCTGYNLPVVGSGGPWWQTKDGDVVTNGSIFSNVPSGNVFATEGSGGYPGIPIYWNSFNLSSTPSLISAANYRWQVNTQTFSVRTFDYDYFFNLIPDGVVSGQTVNGYKWIMVDGASEIAGNDYGSEKVIYFVNGNATINGNITLTDGAGFFFLIASGDIDVDPSVTNLEGIYFTDTKFTDGTNGPNLDSRLVVRGSVVSNGLVTLQRDLANDAAQSAELFEFAPDQILLFPPELAYTRARWTEVAP